MVPTGFVELAFGNDAQVSAAQRALAPTHEVSRVESKLVVADASSVADIADVFIRLRERGIEPTAFSRQLPTLDDVFFKILDDAEVDRYANAQ
jgi:hypothetical protein